MINEMTDYSKYRKISPTAYADVLERKQVMDIGIKQVWTPTPRIAGKAYTVKCHPGDNLMLHAAIYRAEPGTVIEESRRMLPPLPSRPKPCVRVSPYTATQRYCYLSFTGFRAVIAD